MNKSSHLFLCLDQQQQQQYRRNNQQQLFSPLFIIFQTTNNNNQDGKVQKLEQQLNEAKNENNYLNEHIYALDEFIRDKEAQNEDYENKIDKIKRSNQTLVEEKF